MTTNVQIRRIGVILFQGCDLMDMAGPVEVFATAARKGGASYELHHLSPKGGLVTTWNGVKVLCEPLESIEPGYFDTVVITGGLIDGNSCDPQVVDWLRRNHDRVRRIGSVCTGAFYLARAGLLDGMRATTHWEDSPTLQEQFPEIRVTADSIFVREGPVWTAAGVTTGIDMALAMVEEDYGRDLAMAVARNMIVFLRRSGGQSQFSTEFEAQVRQGPLMPLLKWMVEHPAEDLRAETLAERANMSLRNFYRAFEEATGTSPADWVEAMRLGIAKRLLEQTEERVDQIALKAGFVTYEKMRRCFARRLGISPATYRERFAAPSSRPDGAVNITVLQAAFGLVENGRPTIQ